MQNQMEAIKQQDKPTEFSIKELYDQLLGGKHGGFETETITIGVDMLHDLLMVADKQINQKIDSLRTQCEMRNELIVRLLTSNPLRYQGLLNDISREQKQENKTDYLKKLHFRMVKENPYRRGYLQDQFIVQQLNKQI